MAEVFISGSIESADGFGDNQLSIRWQISHGGGWKVMNGESEGQTQTDCPSIFEQAYLSHPLDLHLSTNTIQGWPKILIQVWHHDNYGRQEIAGYGSLVLPSSSGSYQLKCGCWRPKGSWREEMMQKFVGGGMQLSNLSILENPQLREKITSISTGSVNFDLNIITKNFQKFGIIS
ncbi:unnamed protein product [Caenorhabditis angaria]|uniref:B9 domain-containing protein 2 n=1 Tax=Caenorhabditis angaria TaxID=860376 RepID=A0A9P1IP44_9PELO|nr:unnamed protein product [Caenorhabditis angaria]